MRNKKFSLVYGVGINDSGIPTYHMIDGKKTQCPFYKRWVNILERCYSEKWHKKYPTYKDCSVCDEWLFFSAFKLWMVAQDWEGNQIDKDILLPGNKIYGPEECIFVSGKVNSLLIDCGSARGNYPIGVTFNKRTGKFISRCMRNGKKVGIGSYDDELEASKAYKSFKYKVINEVAESQEPRIRNALRVHAELLLL